MAISGITVPTDTAINDDEEEAATPLPTPAPAPPVAQTPLEALMAGTLEAPPPPPPPVQAPQTTPAIAADTKRLSNTFNTSVTPDNVKLFREQETHKNLLDVQAPVLKDLLERDPVLAAMAAGSLPQLVQTENVARELSFLGSGAKTYHVLLGLGWRFVEAGAELVDEDVEQFAQEAAEAREATAAEFGETMSIFEAAKDSSGGKLWTWFKQSVPEVAVMMAPSIAGGIGGAAIGAAIGGPAAPLTATIGGIIGAFIPSWAMGTGEVQSGIKAIDKDIEAPGVAFLGGSAIGIIESLVPGRGTARLFKNALGEEGSKEFLKQLTKRTLSMNAAKAAGGDATVEIFTEVVQTAIEHAAVAIGTDTPVNIEEMTNEMVEAAAKAALGGSAFGAGTQLSGDLVKARRAKGLLSRLDQLKNEMELTQIDPEAAGDSIAAQAKANDVPWVFVDREALTIFIMNHPVEERADVINKLGIAEDFAGEQAFVQVQIEGFSRSVLGTDGYKELAVHAKLEEEDNTYTEAVNAVVSQEGVLEEMKAELDGEAFSFLTPEVRADLDKLLADVVTRDGVAILEQAGIEQQNLFDQLLDAVHERRVGKRTVEDTIFKGRVEFLEQRIRSRNKEIKKLTGTIDQVQKEIDELRGKKAALDELGIKRTEVIIEQKERDASQPIAERAALIEQRRRDEEEQQDIIAAARERELREEEGRPVDVPAGDEASVVIPSPSEVDVEAVELAEQELETLQKQKTEAEKALVRVATQNFAATKKALEGQRDVAQKDLKEKKATLKQAEKDRDTANAAIKKLEKDTAKSIEKVEGLLERARAPHMKKKHAETLAKLKETEETETKAWTDILATALKTIRNTGELIKPVESEITTLNKKIEAAQHNVTRKKQLTKTIKQLNEAITIKEEEVIVASNDPDNLLEGLGLLEDERTQLRGVMRDLAPQEDAKTWAHQRNDLEQLIEREQNDQRREAAKPKPSKKEIAKSKQRVTELERNLKIVNGNITKLAAASARITELNKTIKKAKAKLKNVIASDPAKFRDKAITVAARVLEGFGIDIRTERIIAARAGFKAGIAAGKTLSRTKVTLQRMVEANKNLTEGNKKTLKARLAQPDTLVTLKEVAERVSVQMDLMSVRNQKKQAAAAIDTLVTKHKTRSKLRPKGRMTPEISKLITNELPRIFDLTPEEALAELKQREMPTGEVVDPGPLQNIENMALRIVGIDDEVSVADLERLLVSLNDIIVLGKGIRKANLFRRAALIGDLRERVRQGINPVVSEATFTRDGEEIVGETRKFDGRENSALAKFGLGVEGALLGQSGAWHNIIARVMVTDDKAAVKAILDELGMFEESRTRTRNAQKRTQELQDKIMGALDTTSTTKYLNTMQDWQTEEVTVGKFFHATPKKGQPKHEWVTFTVAELMQRSAELQNDKQAQLAKDGDLQYTDEIIEAIHTKLTKPQRDVRDAMMEWYADYYPHINAAYKLNAGVDLPQIEKYVPVSKADDVDIGATSMLSAVAGSDVASSGHHVTRVDTKKALVKKSIFGVAQAQIIEMEYYIAYAEKTRTIAAVFDSEMLHEIEKIYGKNFKAAVKNYITYFARKGVINAQAGDQFLLQLMRNFSVAQLGLSGVITAKQFMSSAAFAEGVSTKNFMAGVAHMIAHPKKARDVLNEMEFFRTRGIRMDQDWVDVSDNVFGSRLLNVLGRNPRFTAFVTWNIRFGDKMGIAIGAYPHIYAMEKELIAGGMGQAEAHAKALKSAGLTATRTQQSADPDQISSMQRGHVLARLMAQFMSSANALTRAEYAATVEFARGRASGAEFAKAIVIYHLIIPNMIQLAANMFHWDEEDQIRASLFGAFNGIFVLGDFIEALSYIFMKEFLDAEDMQLFSTEIRHPLKVFEDVMFVIAHMDEIEWSEIHESQKKVDKLMRSVGGITGIPIGKMYNMTRGVKEVTDGNVPEGLALLLGWSAYSIEKNLQ